MVMTRDRAWAGWLAALALLLAVLAPARAELTFPALTGRVVDAANIIPADQRAALSAKLEAYDAKTSDQIVVATVPSLQGTSIEDYANRLFRTWKLGQEKSNNGVLLLVAPNERKVRIEVGYGLEGQLTDALSSVIISTLMAPRFKAGDFPGGIDKAVDAIEAVLTGDEEWQRRAKLRPEPQTPAEDWIVLAIFVAIFLLVLYVNFRNRGGGGSGGRPYRTSRGTWIVIPSGGGSWGGGGGWSGGGGGFSSGGGGFSGGGGSSGGGGASGSW